MSISRLSFSTAFTLNAVPPYDFSLTVHKPAGWSLLTPFETFEASTLWTALRLNAEEVFGLRLKSQGTVNNPKIQCTVFSHEKPSPEQKSEFSRVVAWMLRVDEDLTEFYAMAANDPIVKILVQDLYGMRRTARTDIFPSIILAVTLQMAPIKRSEQMWRLLIDNYGARVKFDGKEISYWPSQQKIAQTETETLKAKCKLGYRAEVLRGIAQSLQKGFPTMEQLDRMSTKEARARLMTLRGVGEYSADIVSPHMGFAVDVWSAKIFSLLLLGEKPESPRTIIPKLKDIAEARWGMWQGYVFAYVLNDLPSLSRKFNLKLEEL